MTADPKSKDRRPVGIGGLVDVPICGARTRAGTACRQVAMKNGRCFMHGGKSTGPRTPEGLAACRAAAYRHGGRSAETIAFRRMIRELLRGMA